MTAPVLSDRAEQVARSVAAEIASTFRAKRLERGDRQRDVAEYIGIDPNEVCAFERKPSTNMMLGKAVRMLGVYGLTLAVVPKPK